MENYNESNNSFDIINKFSHSNCPNKKKNPYNFS